MTTPVGWALANMWYDTARGLPEPGGPLESVFLLVFLQRHHSQLLANQALVQAQLLALDGDRQDPVIKAFQEYNNVMYPFTTQAADIEGQENKKKLEEFVRWKARIDLRPIWREKIDRARHRARIAKTKAASRPLKAEPLQAQPFAPPPKKKK